MIKLKIGLVCLVCFVFSLPVSAQERVIAAAKRTDDPRQCQMQENASVSFNFNGHESDLSVIQPKIEKKIADAKALAQQAGITSIEIQNYNYNVSSNSNHGDCSGSDGNYNMSGSVTLSVKPIDKISAYAALLSKNGFNTNFNVNAYNQCQGYGD